MCFWIQSESQNSKEQETLIAGWNLICGHSIDLNACTVLSRQVDGMLEANVTLCHSLTKQILIRHKQSSFDYNTCDVTACLILGGSMSMLYVGRYYIATLINYSAACYDITLRGQNDWLMMISYVNSAVGNTNCSVMSDFGTHCFLLRCNRKHLSCQSLT